MPRRLAFLLAVAVSCAPVVARAEAPAFKLYPVRGIFGLASVGSGGRSLLDARFVAALGQEERDYFEAKFRAAFPESVAEIDGANKRRTFAVSVQVTRASYYTVSKPAIRSVDVLLPMTASIYFSNVLTGEVLLSATLTHVPRGTLSEQRAQPDSPEIPALYRRHFRELIDSLVAEARSRFHPRSITAKVHKDWKGLAVLDAGTDGGVQVDDSLEDAEGNELRVVWAEPGYAVARTSLGKFRTGQAFSRVSNGTLAEIQRPRLLPLIEETPEGMPQEAVLQLFSDALGDASPVSVMPVNRTFVAVLQAVAAKSEISQDEVRSRALPELFVRLRVAEPVSFELPTDRVHKRRRLTEATALVQVQDASGRVLFATVARSRVEDAIIDGMALDQASRREVVVKNALVELAHKFSAGFRPRSLELPVTQASGETFEVTDPQGLLTEGRNLRVFRGVGRINRAEARVPIWEAEVSQSLERTAMGRTILPLVQDEPSPKRGDVVLFEGVDAPKASRRRIGPCGHADRLGAISLPEYEVLALNQFAAVSPAPYHAPGLQDLVGSLVNEGTGFAKSLNLRDGTFDLCVEPVYRIDPLPRECADTLCADVASVRLTYRIRQGGVQGEVKAKRGLETRMTATALPADSSPDARAQALHLDLVDEVLKLSPRIAAAFAKDSF